MPINDLYYLIQWWLVLFITGFFLYPFTAKFFPLFKDKGYAFGKIIGVVFVGYSVYILGLLRILRFSASNIYIIFILISIITIFLSRNRLKQLYTKRIVSLLVLEEIIFFLALLGWSYVRGHNPEIYGLEKYMDFGFVNSILRSDYFPPIDMWFPPHPINYYYFGHFITALLTKASNIPSNITYNLMIATLFALTFLQSFSLGLTLIINNGKNIIRGLIGGLLIASLITLSGNLHVIYTFYKPYETDKPVPFWNLEFSLINPCHKRTTYEKVNANGVKQTINCSIDEQKKEFSYPNSYWYPNATRFIHNTIHEFPIYSWVVADLHGHVLDIPVVLLAISLLFSLFIYSLSEIRIKKIVAGKLFLIGFVIAVMYMTNAWDGLTYLLLTLFTLLTIEWKRKYSENTSGNFSDLLFGVFPGIYNKIKRLKYISNHTFIMLSEFIIKLTFILLIFFLFALPFSLNFDSSKIVGGIGVVGAPSIFLQKNTVNIADQKYGYDNRHILKKFFIPDHCKSIMPDDDLAKISSSYSTRKIGPFLFEPDHCLRSPWWQLFILYGFFYFFVVAFILRGTKSNDFNSSVIFIKILILVASILIIIPEFFYMKDIYPDHYRANTMFKLVFQAFIMLSVATGFIILNTFSKNYFKKLSHKLKPPYFLYSITTVVLVSLVFTYPYFAITSYYNKLNTYIGLDGTEYLKNRTPEDYATIKWLNANIINQPVTLEAQGDSYTDYERISANTGLPTVLGWYVHEWLWRGVDAPNPRAEHVKQIYESKDLLYTKNLLSKYNVSYIVIGKLEREKYPMLDENKFEKLGKKIFQSGNNIIIKITK